MKKAKRTATRDREVLVELQALLTRKTWDADTVELIAQVLSRNGYEVEDVE